MSMVLYQSFTFQVEDLDKKKRTKKITQTKRKGYISVLFLLI